MRLGALLFLVVDGTQAQVVLADAKAVFDLGKSDVGPPERCGVLALKVGAKKVAPIGQSGPLTVFVFVLNADGQTFAAFVLWVVAFADVDLK